MPPVDFEARWAVIEAFIEAEAVNPDPAVVAAMREMVRFGEVPELAGPGLGIPSIAGPGLGIPAVAGPGPGIPSVAGPGPGIPTLGETILIFVSEEAAEEAHDMMVDLAEDMMLDDD